MYITTGVGICAPFALTGPDEMRADAMVVWEDFSSVHGTTFPPAARIQSSDGGSSVSVSSGGRMFIHGAGGLSLPGILLASEGTAFTVSLDGDDVQGVGFTVAHQKATSAPFTVNYLAAGGTSLGSVTVPGTDEQGNPAFLGFLDPDARIAGFVVESRPDHPVVITNLTLQRKVLTETNPERLPVAGKRLLELDPNETYLHEGLTFTGQKSGGSMEAVVDHPNAFDLLALFPTLRPGDVLRFERRSLSLSDLNINHTIAAFSASQTLLAGDKLVRLPSVVPAGTPVATPPRRVKGLSIPTDIAGDFIVPSSTFITLPAKARYLFTSLQEPEVGGGLQRIEVSHIPREPFLDWVRSFGLVGPLAEPDSDLDGDGLSLLEEFAYAKSPVAADADAQEFGFGPFLAETEPFLRFNIGVRRDVPLRYLPEYSNDLKTWTTLPQSSMSTIVIEGGRAIYSSVDPAGGGSRFARIRIERIPSP